MVRPLLLGEAPAANAAETPLEDLRPLGGRPARVLCELAGYAPEEGAEDQYYAALTARFECRNLLERYPGPRGRGADFPLQRAREVAAGFALPPVTVMLGRRVAEAFGVKALPWSSFWRVEETPYGLAALTPAAGLLLRPTDHFVAVVPHPSGLGLLYNEESYRDAAGAALRRATQLATEHASLSSA